MNNNYLLDVDFLRQLDQNKNKEIYGKIILLTQDELPVYEIQGKITNGSVNVDGASAIRRTCSLTMAAEEVDINNTYWALKNKFKLEVGVKNIINSNYPEIIWFKQGIYVFTSLNISVQLANFTISLNGKDKMCLLNGEIGGIINTSTDFGKLEEYKKTYTKIAFDEKLEYQPKSYYYWDEEFKKYILDLSKEPTEKRDYFIMETVMQSSSIKIVDIVKNMLYMYAHEPLNNIIINDIENYGLELLEYNGDRPLYMARAINSGQVTNLIINGEKLCYSVELGEQQLQFLEDKYLYNRTNELSSNNQALAVSLKLDDKSYPFNIIKIQPYETVGYRKTPLTYPGELVANVGESVVAILDKIKNMFSDFEYFYDLDGRFVFQKKKTYINNSWNSIYVNENQTYIENSNYISPYAYSFSEGNLLTAFSSSPKILDIKNDFSIQGKRKISSDSEILIHMRQAVDNKPVFYRPILRFDEKGQELIKPYVSDEYEISDEEEVYLYDWREIIYQMALDYYKHSTRSDFNQLVAKANPKYYPNGITGYEQYYADIQGFWRQLYNPEAFERIGEGDNKKDWVELEIENGVGTAIYSTLTGMNQNVTLHPELLNFWFDFIDASGELNKYSVQAIGSRPKTVNNDKITSIYFQETPSVLFLTDKDWEDLTNNQYDLSQMTGYTFIKLPSYLENYFTISAQGKSARDELYSLLNQHIAASDSVTLTTIPIYHLQPNTRILVQDSNTKINGEYIINKITIPLGPNGTSSITTTKVINRVY